MLLNGGSYNGTRIVADSTVKLFTRRAAGTRALGWDTCGGHGSCGKYLGANAYGHTGFTGTSLWIDPDREMFVVLLTNRVHAARARRPAKVICDVRADLADAAALAVTDSRDGILEHARLLPRRPRGGLEPARARRPRRSRHHGKSSAHSSRSKSSKAKASKSKSSKSVASSKSSSSSKSKRARSPRAPSSKARREEVELEEVEESRLTRRPRSDLHHRRPRRAGVSRCGGRVGW